MKIRNLFIDANNLYGWAISQYLPTGDFKKMRSFAKFGCDNDELPIEEDILTTPDDNKFGYFLECDLEYPVEIKKKQKTFLFVLIKQKQILIFSQNT